MVFSMAFAIGINSECRGQEEPTAISVVRGVVAAADALMAELSEAERQKISFQFDDEKQQRNWSNLPEGAVRRGGLRMGDLTDQQKEAVLGLLRATLSPRGLQQVIDNMNGDELLRRDGGRMNFGKDEYFVSILGEPSETTPWMWQFGGHHLGINATICGSQITLSPSLTGGQPVDFEFEGRQVRQLAGDEDGAFALIGSLNQQQRKQAIVGDHHVKLKYGPQAKEVTPGQEGIAASEFTPEQRRLLIDLIQERIGILNETHAKQTMQTITDDLDSLYFSWFGPTEVGSAATFRIQGPAVIIEYSPQHLGGDSTNHTHAMYRDPTNDYGARIVREASIGAGDQ
jgi:hypothetical protein